MFATAQTPAGILVPLKLNQFEYQRRLYEWKKRRKKELALQQLRDSTNEDARRGAYFVRNYGAEKTADIAIQANKDRRQRELNEAERIADLMAMEAAMAFKKGLI